ncbi:MAG TPA: response regulator [Chthoniobacterales bacterium]|jgi:PAS domain S-box-containing protein|nr:response regulator [Chthoniobacterales bacterium]
MKILVVEDHLDSRRSLERLLRRRGHEVVGVASAEEAMTAMADQNFPFLIVDWMLPGKSGPELCRELRAQIRGDETFILLVTARQNTADLERALAAGANDYLTKPLDAALLNVRLSVAERQVRELSERNQARAALEESARTKTEILENTTDGFFAVDAGWRFTYLNPEAEKLLGRTRAELLGTELWQQFPELLGSAFESNFRRVTDEQTTLEFEASDIAGKVCFEMRAYPSGTGMSVFFRDVSERKATEEKRLTTSKLESLGTLAGGIAHDLNNILTVISGNIGLAQIEAPADAPSLLSHLTKAGQAAQHAARLSGQLLTFSKGGSPLKRVTCIAELLRRAAEFSLYGSNLRAELDVPDTLWKAEVDPAQIEQVINALMINAREAMPHGGVVRVVARNVKVDGRRAGLLRPGRYVKIAAIDKGRGVDPKLASKIFDPYFTTKPTASGLGLAISYSIVKKHGGLLHLERSSPEGSTFAFYLPAASRAERNGEQVRVAEAGSRFSAQNRVLVMDDEPGIREITAELLSTLGYEVTAVPDGAEAVKLYEHALRRGEQFHAVILDATIRGGMGGVPTIEKLRDIDPHVTAIICSGYSDEEALSKFLAYGFRAALPKPFTRVELAEVLRRASQTAKI